MLQPTTQACSTTMIALFKWIGKSQDKNWRWSFQSAKCNWIIKILKFWKSAQISVLKSITLVVNKYLWIYSNVKRKKCSGNWKVETNYTECRVMSRVLPINLLGDDRRLQGINQRWLKVRELTSLYFGLPHMYLVSLNRAAALAESFVQCTNSIAKVMIPRGLNNNKNAHVNNHHDQESNL